MSRQPTLLQTVFQRTLIVLAIAYVLINLGRVVRTNYEMNKTIRQLRTEIAELQLRAQQLKNALTYYSSTSYRELEAKRRLSLRRPGETVVLVPENKADVRQLELPNVSRRNAAEEELPILDTARQNARTWIDWVIRGGA